MRLLLSSQYLDADRPPAVMTPCSPSSRAGIVVNALDELGAGRAGDLARETRTLEAFGYRCEELDLRDYLSAPGALGDRLRKLDLVWALGGNTFVLARAMTQSGFAEAVAEHLRRPEFVYGGYSAGACVAGPDLRGIDLMDDPTVVPERYSAAVEPRCLGLVPFRIVPHWRCGHAHSPDAERAATYLTAVGLEYRCLRDGQTISVENGTVSIT